MGLKITDQAQQKHVWYKGLRELIRSISNHVRDQGEKLWAVIKDVRLIHTVQQASKLGHPKSKIKVSHLQ